MENYGSLENSWLIQSQLPQRGQPVRYYPKILLIIGCYYLLPAIQYVFFQAYDNNVECYYNFKCKRDLDGIPAFNNIISNIFYVFFGLLFIVIVRLSWKFSTDGINSLGVHKDPSLYYSLGIVLILEGLSSSAYHVCPSKLNFQFDTTFMFIGSALMGITLYSKRNYKNLATPMKFYSIMSLIIFVNMLPLAGLAHGVEIWFWVIIFIIMAYIMIFGSIYIYYGQEYDLDLASFKALRSKLKSLNRETLPKFILMCAINGFSLGMFIYANVANPDFTDWLLGLCIINMIIYFVYYIISKILHKEKINILWWVMFIVDIGVIGTSLGFFNDPVSNSFLTPSESRELNKDCAIFDYFDYHDIWHILSATGLFIFMNIVYFLDTHLDETEDMQINRF
jgi:hypothetical protein